MKPVVSNHWGGLIWEIYGLLSYLFDLCFAKFELNWLRNKKVMKKPHFGWNEWQN